MKNLVIVGSVALDSVKTPRGEEPKALGGSATYAGIASSLYTPPGIVGVVGDDFPAEAIDLMKAHKLDLEGLQVIEGGKTFHWAGYYEGEMDQAFTTQTDLNVFESFKPELPESYRDAEFIFLANIDPELQLHVLDQVRRPRMILCDTMNFWIEGKKEALLEVFSRTNVVLVNEGEARMLCGTSSLRKAALQILEMGPSYVIIKMGGHGAMLMSHEDTFTLPAFPLENLVDPTGAGDTFAGGFIGHLAAQRNISRSSIRRAMVAGTLLASHVCEDFSVKGTASISTREINKRFEIYREYSRIPSRL